MGTSFSTDHTPVHPQNVTCPIAVPRYELFTGVTPTKSSDEPPMTSSSSSSSDPKVKPGSKLRLALLYCLRYEDRPSDYQPQNITSIKRALARHGVPPDSSISRGRELLKPCAGSAH
ncbi:hypothetical protein VYU27_005258 [Nannochloropsis oceanica]